MGFQFKAPNVISTVAAPQVTVPESGRSHAGAVALSAGLTSIKDIANLYRDHQDAVTQAGAMAEMMDASGMPDEAAAYRKAASTFRPNFFSDPKSANEARKTMLNDALSIIGTKYKREMDQAKLDLQREELGITRDYRQAMASSALQKAQAAYEEALNRANNAESAGEAKQRQIELQAERIKLDEARLQAHKEKWDADAAVARQNAETKARAQQFKEDVYGDKKAAMDSAGETALANGLIEVPTSSGTKWMDPKTKKIKVTVTTDGTGGWVKKVEGLTEEEANDRLPHSGETTPSEEAPNVKTDDQANDPE